VRIGGWRSDVSQCAVFDCTIDVGAAATPVGPTHITLQSSPRNVTIQTHWAADSQFLFLSPLGGADEEADQCT